jgi:hypothetical protein
VTRLGAFSPMYWAIFIFKISWKKF